MDVVSALSLRKASSMGSHFTGPGRNNRHTGRERDNGPKGLDEHYSMNAVLS